MGPHSVAANLLPPPLQVLKSFQKLYGDASAAPQSGYMTFEEFAALFSRPKVTAEGDGNTIGMAVQEAGGKFAPFRFKRRDVGDYDVRIQITHASICHTDIHQAKNDWHVSQLQI